MFIHPIRIRPVAIPTCTQVDGFLREKKKEKQGGKHLKIQGCDLLCGIGLRDYHNIKLDQYMLVF